MSGDRPKKSQVHVLETNQSQLLQPLIEENALLRATLSEVSSAGIVMMHHYYPQECVDFTSDFMQSVVSMAEKIKMGDVKQVFTKGLALASEESSGGNRE
ncbi:MAG: hypothetical protein HKN34_05905 [Gammaproteobacteria bacterium]|nr:hypothetical protein [Gammaproteobacteria bacterium]